MLQFIYRYFTFVFYFIYLSLQDLILAINRQGIDNPLFCVGCKYLLFVCAGVVNEVLCDSPTGLINLVLNWGKYLSLLYYFILSSSRKSQHSSQVAGRISGAVAGETSPKSIKYVHTNYHLLAFTLFAISLSFSSPPLLKQFYKNTKIFFVCLLFVCLFSCLLACLVMMSQENIKLCDFSNTNNNDFISTPKAPPATSAESYDINAGLLNLVMKE